MQYPKFVSIVDLFLICIDIISSNQHINLAHIKNYQIVKQNFIYDSSKPNSIRLNAPRFVFKAFRRNFDLRLREESFILSSETEIFLHKSKEILKKNLNDMNGPLLYEGKVQGKDSSFVHGYFLRNIFVGRISIADNLYFSERASEYLEGSFYRDKALIYKISRYQRTEHNQTDIFEEQKFLNKNQECRKFFNDKRMPNLRKGKLCSLELMADFTLYEDSHYDIKYTISRMLYHIKSADIIFRKTDFDEDQSPEGIGFIVKLITINMHKLAHNSLFNGEFYEGKYFLFKLSLYRQRNKHCLLINFCQRHFSNKTIGVAYAPKERNNYFSGICQNPARIRNYIRTTNVLFVSMSYENISLPRSMIDVALTHELGHSFGGVHDTEEDPNCIVNSYFGKYILNEYITDGSMINNMLFSLCSRKSMNNILNLKGWCLKNYSNEPYCGNGITEDGEECDCGSLSESSCDEIDPCCTAPHDSIRKCKIRRDKGYQCSPREDECCNEECKFISTDSNTVCYVNEPCQMHSFCNGISGKCPIGNHVKDGTPCQGTYFICKSGHCQNSICSQHNMPMCQCIPESRKECHVCCLDRFNICRSAAELGYYTADGRLYLKTEGSECGEKDYCDRYGRCIPRFEVVTDGYQQHIYDVLKKFPIIMCVINLLIVFFMIARIFINQLDFHLFL